MSKSTFKTIEELNIFLGQKIASSLKNNVAPVIKSTQSDMVEQEVYAKYDAPHSDSQEPFVYKRRGTEQGSGGLGDINNMLDFVSNTKSTVALTIVNVTKGKDESGGNSGDQIAPLVEGGQGSGNLRYDYPFNRAGTADKFLAARPFQSATVDQLRANGEHLKAFTAGLGIGGITIT